MNNSTIRVMIFSQVIIMLFTSTIWFLKGDQDKWFSRFSIALILFGIYGIMKHIQKPNN